MLKAHDFSNVNKNTADDFINQYLDSLKIFYKKDEFLPEKLLDDFRTMKERRNIEATFSTL